MLNGVRRKPLHIDEPESSYVFRAQAGLRHEQPFREPRANPRLARRPEISFRRVVAYGHPRRRLEAPALVAHRSVVGTRGGMSRIGAADLGVVAIRLRRLSEEPR